MSVCDQLLTAAETLLKNVPEILWSRDTAGEAERQRKGPIPNRLASPWDYHWPQKAARQCSC